ncbi:unnamed protein product [Ectocarpus fasciculatus]
MEREKQSRLIAPGAGGKHEELPAARTAFVSGFRFPELVQQTLCFARTTTTGTATLVSLTIPFVFVSSSISALANSHRPRVLLGETENQRRCIGHLHTTQNPKDQGIDTQTSDVSARGN